MDFLEVKHISSGYGKKQVLFDVSFSIKKGEIVLLAGSNGSGKSTLLKTIFGLIKPWHIYNQEKPEIWFDGDDITDIEPSSLIKKGLVYVPQKDNYFENLDVQSNLEISGTIIINKIEFKKRISEVYKLLPQLEDNKNKIPMKMSGGERQMLILGMALLHRPKLLMLDEPTLNLSPSNSILIFKKIKELNQQFAITILIVEHKLKESLSIANRMVKMKVGKL